MAAKKQTKPLLEAPVSEVERFALRMGKLVDQVEEMMRDFPVLSADERAGSLGRFREGEEAIAGQMLDVVDAFPAHFAALAGRDRGEDDRVVETGPARDDLARRRALLTVAKRFAPLADRMADAVMVLGHNVRQLTVPAYRIGQVSAQSDAKLRGKLNPVAEFYAAGARKAQRTAKKKSKEASPE